MSFGQSIPFLPLVDASCYTPPFRTRSFQSTVSLTTLGEGEALAVARGVLRAVELPPEVTAALMDKAEGVERTIGLMTCHLFAPTYRVPTRTG